LIMGSLFLLGCGQTTARTTAEPSQAPSLSREIPNNPSAETTRQPRSGLEQPAPTRSPLEPTAQATPAESVAATPAYLVDDPHPDAPLCSSHDNLTFHGLWDEENGCHFDHTHGIDPAETPFAGQAADWRFDFPWQTFSTYGGNAWAVPTDGSVFENDGKHKGFFYLYDEAEGGCELFNVTPDQEPNCVTRVLYQLHSVGTQGAMVTRFHSFRMIAEVCTQDGRQCGTIETGGIHDYGTLHCPYKKGHCPLENDPEGPLPDQIKFSQPPYRAFHTTVDNQNYPPGRDIRDGSIRQFWNSLVNRIDYPYYPHEPSYIVGTAWGFFDSTELLYQSDPSRSYSVCLELLGEPYEQCEFNHSSAALFTVRFTIPRELSRLAEDGVINYSGFTDRYGHPVAGCLESSLDCIPLELVNFPEGGLALLNRPVVDDNRSGIAGEFDIYFDAEGRLCDLAPDRPDDCRTSGWIIPP
ncbi:MAG: hypothetical protein R3335_08465, partial [Anaerolineales bacterium]|nr:hypothetical protein [Anaerolineales bacterium]